MRKSYINKLISRWRLKVSPEGLPLFSLCEVLNPSDYTGICVHYCYEGWQYSDAVSIMLLSLLSIQRKKNLIKLFRTRRQWAPQICIHPYHNIMDGIKDIHIDRCFKNYLIIKILFLKVWLLGRRCYLNSGLSRTLVAATWPPTVSKSETRVILRLGGSSSSDSASITLTPAAGSSIIWGRPGHVTASLTLSHPSVSGPRTLGKVCGQLLSWLVGNLQPTLTKSILYVLWGFE